MSRSDSDLFERAVRGAKTSPLWMLALNTVLARKIPFNRPHRIRILELRDSLIRVRLPLVRSNLNHVGGLHACALATVAEFATGFLLLSMLQPSRYRLLMQAMHIDYLFQGKSDAFVTLELAPGWVKTQVQLPLAQEDAVVVELCAEVYDAQKNHLCSARIGWQVKHWAAVSAQSRA